MVLGSGPNLLLKSLRMNSIEKSCTCTVTYSTFLTIHSKTQTELFWTSYKTFLIAKWCLKQA